MMEEADVTAATEILEVDRRRVLSDADVRDALWYPVGVLLALLAATSVLVFCVPGLWIG
jgi:hypothetical protein